MRGMQREQAIEKMRTFDTYLLQDPSNALLIEEASKCAFAAGLTQKGLDLTNLLVRLHPQSSEARMQVAKLQMENGLWSEAEQHWATLMADGHADDVGVSYARAYSFYRLGLYLEASSLLRPFLNEAYEIFGGRLPALWMRCMHHSGLEADAWAWFVANRLKWEPFVDLTSMASLVALDCGELACARSLAQSALKMSSSDQFEASIVMASLALHDGHLEQCRTILRGIVTRRDEPRAWMTLGLAELMEFRLAEARKCLQRVVVVEDNATAWRMLGWVHGLEGAPELARQAFQRALQRDPDDTEAATALSMFAAEDGLPLLDRTRLEPDQINMIRRAILRALQSRETSATSSISTQAPSGI